MPTKPPTNKPKLPPHILEYFREEGARGGKIGGKRSLETMTRAERVARAKKAVATREANKKKRAPKKKAA